MSKKNKSFIQRVSKRKVIGNSNSKCPHCQTPMVVRKHTFLSEKQLRGSYHFAHWDYCPKCKAVFFDENDKVYHEKIKNNYNNNIA